MSELLKVKIHCLEEKSFSEVGARQAEIVLNKYLPEILGLAVNITLHYHHTHQEVHKVIKESPNSEFEVNLGIVPFSSTFEEGFISAAAGEVFADKDLVSKFALPVVVQQTPAVLKSNKGILDGEMMPDALVSHPAALRQVRKFVNDMGWNDIPTILSNSTAEGFEIVASNPEHKLVGFGRGVTAIEKGLSVGQIASESITRMSLLANKNTPNNILSALDKIAKIENKTKITNLVITNLNFPVGQYGQLYDLLNIFNNYGVDVRYAQLGGDNPSYITCTLPTDKVPFVESFLNNYNLNRNNRRDEYLIKHINEYIDSNHPELTISEEDKKLPLDSTEDLNDQNYQNKPTSFVGKMNLDPDFKKLVEDRNKLFMELFKKAKEDPQMQTQSIIINKLSMIGDSRDVTGDIYNEPEDLTPRTLNYQILSEKFEKNNVNLTLEIPDKQGSLLELLRRFKEAKINLLDLVIKVTGNKNEGEVRVKFRNDENILTKIKENLN